MTLIKIFLFFKPHNFKKNQQNLIISKSATIHYFSSNMSYGIGRDRELRKQNRKKLENTTDPYLAPSNPSYSYDKLNENTDITSKKSLTAETHSRTLFSIEYKPSRIIQKNLHPTRTQKTKQKET